MSAYADIVDKPQIQPFWQYSSTPENTKWAPVYGAADLSRRGSGQPALGRTDALRLITWNIDFQVPFPKERMEAALQYLEQLLADESAPPTVIFFQEMVPSDIDLIKTQKWIQERFFITDISGNYWTGYYGTTTLVDKRLTPQRVFRVPYSASRMQRDGLFVDVDIDVRVDEMDKKETLRLCNTHLESLVPNPPLRPVQMKLASEFMHNAEKNTSSSLPVPHAAILAGDMNAFGPEDPTSPQECGLQDTFLALGGQEGTEEGFTWGQQVPAWMQEKFGYGRLDKVLFCGGIEALRLQRIGEGVKASVKKGATAWVGNPTDSSSRVEEDSKEVWVTDHLGLSAEFKVIPKA